MRNEKVLSRAHRLQYIYDLLLRAGEDGARSARDICLNINKSFGTTLSKRTIERDLSEMATNGYRLASTETYPVRWYATRDFNPDVEIKLKQSEVEAILLALESLKQSAPKNLERKCTSAMSKLLGNMTDDYSEFLEQFRDKHHFNYTVLGKSIPLDDEAVEEAMNALYEGRCFSCLYTKPLDEPREYRVAPLFFHLSGGTPYLYVESLNSGSRFTLNLARVEQIKKLDQKAPSFDKNSIKNINYAVGGYGYGEKDHKLVDYMFECSPEVAVWFKEHWLHPGQKIDQISKNIWRVAFTLVDSQEIYRLLAGFYSQIYKFYDPNIEVEVLKCFTKDSHEKPIKK